MSGFRIPLIAYDPQSSSTSLPISCASPACHVAVTIAEAGCNSDKNCGYFFQYGDGSSTHGYLVTDSFSYNPVGYGSTVLKKETKLIFGCGYNQSGNLVTSDRALDGILGLGQSDLSIVSQLASQGMAPKAFGHCLRGIGNGGGALILGHVKEPGLVYTPIVRSRLHYNVEMRNILVNNVALNVNASSFEAGNSQETIFDSGTTLTYVSEPLYKAFMQAILAHLPPQAEIIQVQDNTCFYYSGSVDNHFPNVTIRFKGADMHLKANNYLIEEPSQNPPIWCVGWQVSASYNGITLVIFGDLVLKDKLVTYDLEKRQIGWANYDCSSGIAVSSARENYYVIPCLLRHNDSRTRKYIVYVIWLFMISYIRIICMDF